MGLLANPFPATRRITTRESTLPTSPPQKKHPIRSIELRGAAEHNLKNIDVNIPLHKLTVLCGVSGSGKTSLALDTLYAEGQRRYIESFSAYARQFLARLEKPKFDRLDHLPPTLAITRSDRSRNNRSTVGTTADLLEPLRVLFSLIANPFCLHCKSPLQAFSPSRLCNTLETFSPRRAILAVPITWKNKSELAEQFLDWQASGWTRWIVNHATIELSDDRKTLAKLFPKTGQAYVVFDRFRCEKPLETSIRQSIEQAFEHNHQQVTVFVEHDPSTPNSNTFLIDERPFALHQFSTELRCNNCPDTQTITPPPEPRLFSFNSPLGACPTCTGFGESSEIDLDKILPDKTLSLREGAIAPWRTPAYQHELEELIAIAPDFKINLDSPASDLSDRDWQVIQHGSPKHRFGGLDGFFTWLERKKYKMHVRIFLNRWKSYKTCRTCHGKRLSQGALAYQFDQKNFYEITELSIDQLSQLALSIHDKLPENSSDKKTAIDRALNEVLARLNYLRDVGLGYLTLSRTMHTLSGGEAQRVQLTNLLGSDLVDMLYVLDEPTVGLHPTDTQRVAKAVHRLIQRGNTVLLIEHEPYLLQQADQVIEIGPQAGVHGGQVCFCGTPSELEKSNCLTAKYLFAKQLPPNRRTIDPQNPKQHWLRLQGANGRNLKNVDLKIPLNCFCSVVGVSGAGKSSLILDTLVPAILQQQNESPENALPFRDIHGYQEVRRIIAIDQSPIAKSIRSCSATYLKILDEIRSLFGKLPEAKLQGLRDGDFSFNSGNGRCPTCEGLGFTLVDMQFMADIQIPCGDCRGKRFQPKILDILFRNKSIADVLTMSADDAQDFFRGEKKILQKLQPLRDIGLGYLPIGQSLSTLSAGEMMRLKLASYLDDPSGSLIVMDEPTTGLHFHDVERLVQCIQLLIERKNSVIAIEHNESLIAASDYTIELGPGAGPNGGEITYQGPWNPNRTNR